MIPAGVGLDKVDWMPRAFDAPSLAAMCALRRAFDPDLRANPGKGLPARACRQWTARGAR